jgi:hypothetical protein
MMQLTPGFGDLLSALMYCTLLWCWGWVLQRGQQKRSWILAFPLGMSLMGILFPLLVFLEDSVPGSWLLFAWPLLVLGGLLALPSLVKTAPTLRLPAGWRNRFALGACLWGILPFLVMLPVLIRPQLSFDLLSYHLPLAHELASGSGLALSPWDYYRNLPLTPMLLYGPVLSSPVGTLDDPGVRVILFLAWFFTALGAGRLAGLLGGRRLTQALAFGLVGYAPMFSGMLLNSSSDVLTACVAVAGVNLLPIQPRRFNTRSIVRYLLCGLLLGTAYGMKQSAIVVVNIPAILILLSAFAWGHWKKTAPLKFTLPVFALVGFGMFVAMSPWLIRSTVLTGNPFFPLAGTSEEWSQEQQTFLKDQHRVVSPLSAGHIENMLNRNTVWGPSLSVFRYVEESDSFTEQVYLPPLFWLLLLVWAFGATRRLRTGLMAFMCLLGYVAWSLVGVAPDRFMAPLVAISGAFVAVVVTQQHPILLRRGLYLLAGAYILLGTWRELVTTPLGGPPSLRLGWYADAWRRDSVFPVAMLERHRLEQQQLRGKTWLIFESRDRWFLPPMVSNKVWNPLHYFHEHEIDSVEQLLRILREDGVTQIVVNDAELRRYVQFYGADKRSLHESGVRSSREVYKSLVENFPAVTFTKISDKELTVLVEFLRLSRLQAWSTFPVGSTADIWIGPLPQSTGGTLPSSPTP